LARVPDEAIRRRKELTHGAWVLYVEYCRHRNHDDGRCDPGLSTLATVLDRTYRHVSDCKTELVKKGWVRRAGKNGVDLCVGFGPPKVRAAAANSKYVSRPAMVPKSELVFGKFPNTSSGGIRTQVREESELGETSPYSEPVVEPVAAEAAAAAGSHAAHVGGTEVCDDAYVAEVKARGRYPPDFVDFVWLKLRERCQDQGRRFGYSIPPVRRQFDWWLENELTPPQMSLLPGAGRAGDVRLGRKGNCDSSCPQCFGTGMWYPEGFEKGVARCPGASAERRADDGGLKVVNGGEGS
jgi:hypothetical protein